MALAFPPAMLVIPLTALCELNYMKNNPLDQIL